MKLILRTAFIICFLGLSMSFVLFGCQDTKKTDNSLLMLGMLNACREPKAGEQKIYIFRAVGYYVRGKFTNSGTARNAANMYCSDATTFNFPFIAGKTIKAFISVSGTDQVKDLGACRP